MATIAIYIAVAASSGAFVVPRGAAVGACRTRSVALSPALSEGQAASGVRRYFEAWNRRDMDAAVALFAEECEYDDTQYPGAFTGKKALRAHLIKVADALPTSFAFCIDDIADGGDTVGVRWHVENNGQPLPFTRGCSLYKTDAAGYLVSGFDVPEPAPFKPGSASLLVLGAASKIIAEPIRAVAALTWLTYVLVVFFSNGILPGPDATQLDGATWDEVLGLSLNFWLVAPLLQLPFSPVLHPGLEGLFNLLLAWAAAFAGFLVDGRPGRPSGSFLPYVAGMQFLTNAALLPYLVLRTPESGAPVYVDDLAPVDRALGEWRPLGPVLAAVGTGAVAWGCAARPEFGPLAERAASLLELLSHDRLGASFVVDLGLFALFQGWLVDDDLRRRGVPDGYSGALRALAKLVPFYGLCAYLALRPPLPRREFQPQGPAA